MTGLSRLRVARTLHDTVEIAYQVNVSSCSPPPSTIQTVNANVPLQEQGPSTSDAQMISTKGRKGRRAYETSGLDIPPYRKKLKIIASNYVPFR